MGKLGAGSRMNENGTRFCLANDLVIEGTLFQHRDIHKTTWTSPCSKHKNQIYHIAISRRQQSFLLDVCVKRGGDGSDHQLGESKLRFKLEPKREC